MANIETKTDTDTDTTDSSNPLVRSVVYKATSKQNLLGRIKRFELVSRKSEMIKGNK